MLVYFSSFFILFVQNVRSDVHSFTNCEKSILEVNRVIFGNCSYPPCEVRIREIQNISLEMNSVYAVPFFRSINTTATLSLMNVKWPLSIYPTDPCVTWKCPLDETVTGKKFNASIDFNEFNILRPGILIIEGFALTAQTGKISIFCVKFNVDLN